MFDEQRFYLGSLCKRSHFWQETNQSLRYRSTRECVQCSKENAKERASTPEGRAGLRKADKKYYASDHGRKKIQEYGRLPERAQARADNQLRYRQTAKGQATRGRAEKKYMETEGRRVSWRRKDIKRKKLKSGNREVYTVEDQQALYQKFNQQCAYCGGAGTTRDHVIPLNKYGIDAIRNLVPACFSCNSSKQDKDAEIWYRSRPFFDEGRWKAILDHISG